MTGTPEQVLIVSTIQQATIVVGQMFAKPGSPVFEERPGCSLIAPIHGWAGVEILPVGTPTDGLHLDLWPELRNARAGFWLWAVLCR